ncbi:SubName: Full=Uncharacterized protein {ECO:0000313/EMBL:CCA74242.1} [Serendipita indica DSM 11827]|nr:SubName: Full=Uncharacterized protein {ECO:0000313/EMBL:CCA74242.1} [Serendipita indica DSM 11827]
MSSLSCSSSSSSSQEDLSTNMRDEKDDVEPVFTTMPTRRARSSGTIARTPAGGLSFTSINGTTCISNSSGESVSPISRRTPSFPVSRPIRPFDSISNAMGTQPKRVSPTTEAPFAASKTLDSVQKPKAVEPESKPKPWRSSKLLEPPKNNRFQNGFFILDMTQDEFKSRAW